MSALPPTPETPAVPADEPPPPPPPAPSAEQHQKACGYAMTLADGFIKLAAGGIAFVVGLVFSEKGASADPALLRWSIAIFAASILLGWLFLMRMTGKIARQNDYRIYEPFAQAVSFFQIVLFGIGIALLASLLWQKTGFPPASKTQTPAAPAPSSAKPPHAP